MGRGTTAATGGRRAAAEGRERRRAARRARRGRVLVWCLVLTVAVVGLLFLAVYPARTYLAQRTSVASAEERLAVLTARADALEARAEALDTDAEIERLARSEYNLVRPGEEAFAVLPPAEHDPQLGFWENLLAPLGP